MAKIIDPDLLNQGTEITFDTSAKTVTLAKAGNLSDDGVAIQCLYSFCKEEWKSDDTLIKHPFPLRPIDGPSGTQFDLIGDWIWADSTTIGLIRDGGWALKDSTGAVLEMYMNVTSLGSFNDSANDQAYYTQGDLSSPTDINLTGEVNQAIKIYGDVDHGDVDYRDNFIMYLREQGKIYDSYDLILQQNISALTYKKYALPLSNSLDLKITHDDTTVGDTAGDYANIDITYYADNQTRNIGGTDYNFKIIIEGDNKTLEQIYEKVEYLLRQTGDIDEGDGTVRGDTANDLLYFVGDTLYTKRSVFIDNILSTGVNRIVFTDDGGVERIYPYIATGEMAFNTALQNDTDAKYTMFFTNDDDGDNNGYDFGTDNAIIVNDYDGNAISGTISGNSSIVFTFDYDGNIQRGSASAGIDAPVTLVAIGLESAQYVTVEGVLRRTKTNNFGFVANEELTYSNPA